MNLYVENSKVKHFYFRVILTLFLQYYKNYEIVKDTIGEWSYENIFLLYNKDTDKKELVIFFYYKADILKKCMRKQFFSNEISINVYYVLPNPTKNKEKNLHIKKHLLNNELFEQLKDINDTNCIHNINNYLDDTLFNYIFNDFLENKLFEKERLMNEIYYKYKGTNGHRVQEMIAGEFTYVSPSKFNDPFDCDFIERDFKEGRLNIIDKKDNFRILCLTPIMDNILMWGYYGNNHNGIAVGHALSDYLKATAKVYNGLIIYGNVNYKKSRPNYIYDKKYLKLIPFTDILSNMTKCCFTKFEKWKYEEEFRIMTLYNGFDSLEIQDKDFINVIGKTSSLYKGVKYSGKFQLPSYSKQLVKDKFNYKLNIKQ